MSRFEKIAGGYVHVDIAGKHHRIYYEEAGQGIPLLCLHTAGADGRQYRHVLNDPEVTQKFRVIAFDMPWHGKSSPPEGWQNDTYRLTTDSYMEMVQAFTDALDLHRPVVMGCSIGGRAVLHIALRYGAAYRAAIGLQSNPWIDARMHPLIRDIAYLDRPDVNAQEAAAATITGLVAPMSPSVDKWETIWGYMQGGPGVLTGDLYFYMVDGDMRNGLLAGLDTQKCPVYLLTGDRDYSVSPELTAELRRQVPGAKFQQMKDIGHFPMSENGPLFLSYLRPVLAEILETTGAA